LINFVEIRTLNACKKNVCVPIYSQKLLTAFVTIYQEPCTKFLRFLTQQITFY